MLFNAPQVVKNIREIELIYEKTDVIGYQLDLETNELDQNIYLSSANDEKLKKMEKILNIQKASDDTLESRRFRVKSKVYQRLPYSYRVLISKLDSLCGEKAYRLDVNVVTQEISCIIGPDQHPAYRTINRMLEDIVPMNMLVKLAASFPAMVSVPIETQSKLVFVSAFYPRENLQPLYLNGEWILNADKYLNGYNAERKVDFYPVNLLIRSVIEEEVNNCITLNIKTAVHSERKMGSLFFVPSNFSAKMDYGNRTTYKSEVERKVNAEAYLTIEKDLWYLDGGEQLNGNRILDAQICQESL